MTPCLWQIRLVVCVVALGTSAGLASSQEVSHPSTAMVIRQQLGSIAQEVVGRLQSPAGSAVAITVSSQADRELAENAFVESVQDRGLRPYLNSAHDSAGTLLKIVILDSRALFTEIKNHAYRRTVRTELEARAGRSDGDSLVYLGKFHRTLSDTVSANDTEARTSLRAISNDEDATFFQRLAGPLIVLASGIVVVYLFFTVRS